MKNKTKYLIMIVLLLTMSCLSNQNKNTTTTSESNVPQTVLLTLETEDYEEYANGIFLTAEGWHKVETNMIRLQREIELLRSER